MEGRVEGEGGNLQADSLLSKESGMGLNPSTLGPETEQSWTPNQLSHVGAP